MRTRAILHVGPNKTGSSSMVKYMNAAGDRLPPNVLYPGEEFGFHSQFKTMRHNWDLARVKIDKASGRVSFFNPETAPAMDNLLAHMRGLDHEEVSAVFVCESLSRDSQEIEMAGLLRGYFDEVVIVKVARKQDDLLASVMVQSAKSWRKEARSLDWRKFSSRTSKPDFMDFDQSLARWEKEKPENPGVRYEFVPFLETDPGTENLLRRFFTVTHLTDMPEGVIKPGLRINSSIPAAAVKKLVAYKKWDHVLGWIPPIRVRLAARHHALSLQSLLEMKASGLSSEGTQPVSVWRIDAQGCEQILNHYRPSNQTFVNRVDQHGLVAEWQAWARAAGVVIA
jgi:hypothetical protein